MKKTLRCPSCDQRIRVEVPEPKRSDGEWELVVIVALIVAPLIALAVLGGMR